MGRGRTGWQAVAAVACAAAGAGLAWLYERPPAALPLDAPAAVFSAERARETLEQIARGPRVPGSAEHGRVREWLVDRLEALGFEVEVQEATPFRLEGSVVRAATVRNILARRRGTAATGGVALAAHYDTRELAPGAADDGAGVAAILEAARALAAAGPLRNDLYLLFTDAEEFGLFGSAALIDGHRWWPEIDVLLNFEARGSAGASVMFETNTENGWIVREFARADPYPYSSSLYYEIYKQLPNGTDFDVFKTTPVDGLNFGFVEGADSYHRPSDTVENLSLASLQHHGEHAVALGRHFGNLDLAVPTRSPDVVYLRVPLLGLVVYSAFLAKVFAAGALLLAVLAAWRGIVRRRLTVFGTLAGLGSVIGGAALAAGLAFVLLAFVRIVHHEDGSIVGRLLYDELWYGLATIAIAIGSLASCLVALRRRFALSDLTAGALLIPLALVVLCSWNVPGISMLFVWPAVLALLQLLWLLKHPDAADFGVRDLIVLGALSVPIAFVLFPLPYAIYIGLNISSARVLAAVIVLSLAFLVPLFGLAGLGDWRLPALSYVTALGLTLVGFALARPGPERPLPVGLNYVLDRDEARAFWVTTALDEPAWLEPFVGPDSEQTDLDDYGLGVLGTVRVAPAPLVPAPPVEATFLAGADQSLPRIVQVELRPPLGQESIGIYSLAGRQLALRSFNGMPIDWPEGGDGPTDWVITHRGLPPDGVLTLSIAANTPVVELVVLETRMSLPGIAGLELQRPPHLVAPGLEISDISRFRQRLSFD